MANASWTWDAREHSGVMGVLAATDADFKWCVRLEKAPGDAIVGKVLCVCASAAIARAAIAAQDGDTTQAAAALDLLERWIDDPTEDRFDRICSLVFDESSPEFDPHGVVLWALRTATSSVGFTEAAWALETTCSAALEANLTPEQLHVAVEQELRFRSRPEGWFAARRV